MTKQKVFSLVIYALVGLVSARALGQSMPAIKVNIPFAFSLEDKTYPSGEYTFSAMKPNVVLVQGTDHTPPAVIMTNQTAERTGQDKSSVRFQCYASECFVSEIWIPGRDNGFELRRSRAELQAARETNGKYLALLGSSAR